jgi:two-component system chemotaxis response regulator CheB
MGKSTIRTLVIDDSALYRKFVASALKAIPEIEVVGTASNGQIGLEKIRVLQPDLITLDLEMPVLDGLGLLRELSHQKIDVTTIVVSAITTEGAKATNTALHLGAFDFVLKPVGHDPEESRQKLENELVPRISALVGKLHRKKSETTSREPSLPQSHGNEVVSRMAKRVDETRRKPLVVGIGISTGGPVALGQVLPKLPADFPCPIFIVQHMPPVFTQNLAEDLNRKCAITVKEASDGHIAEAGEALIAPGGNQMRIEKIDGHPVVQVNNDPPERSCKPSVDYLFRSLAHQYGEQTVAAILTGMGDDGTLGCKLLKRKGALILAQDESSCVVYGMPKSVVEAGVTDHIIPLDNMAECLVASVTRGAIRC